MCAMPGGDSGDKFLQNGLHPAAPLGEGVSVGASQVDSLGEFERAFVQRVWDAGRTLYRDLPWRNTHDAYAILVSEVMLQQTQVKRVVSYWERFLRLFPTLDALAAADVPLALEAWQGLGYNRRALALKHTAETCAAEYGGQLPRGLDELMALPGIGKATAAGVRAFAFGLPGVYLETNVRTVFLHEFFPGAQGVPDKELEPLVRRTCSVEDPRGWYYALLDYGAHLKATLPNPSRRSKHHARQSPFEGSHRQKRAECVRYLLGAQSASYADLYGNLAVFERDHGRPAPAEQEVRGILDELVHEGFFRADGASGGQMVYRV